MRDPADGMVRHSHSCEFRQFTHCLRADPCLLLAEEWTGVQRMTELQTRAQFNMWAIMASPLLISANVINMSATNLATYKNKKVGSTSARTFVHLLLKNTFLFRLVENCDV